METKLFVANFDEDVTEDNLGDLFSSCGKVVDAKIWRNLETYESRGFGFVEMENEEDARRAIDELNRTEWRGHRLQVRLAQPDKRLREIQRMQDESPETKLFVANFGKSVHGEDLNELFSDYGRVMRAHVVRDPDTLVSRGFGFVEMEWEEEAEQASRELNGKRWRGGILKVCIARPRR